MDINAESIAKELVRGINSQKTRKGKGKINIFTLCDFGQLGLLTPLELVDAFTRPIKEDEIKFLNRIEDSLSWISLYDRNSYNPSQTKSLLRTINNRIEKQKKEMK